jgi:hypothetical protein
MLPFRCLQGDFDFPFFWFGEIWGRGCTLFSETTCHAQAFCMERHVPDFRCKYRQRLDPDIILIRNSKT